MQRGFISTLSAAHQDLCDHTEEQSPLLLKLTSQRITTRFSNERATEEQLQLSSARRIISNRNYKLTFKHPRVPKN